MTTLPVIVNPVARGGRTRLPRERLERLAAERGMRLEWWATREPGHASELAARAARERFPVLGVWGGDGTYNEAARGLVGTETALLALPGGTTSVLAYELGIPRDPERALIQQLEGERRSMAVGRTDAGQLFLLMVSAGPDALILTNLPPFLKLRGGKVGITAQAVLEFLRGNLPQFTVTIDGERFEASWCIAGNARSYAGPFAATPGADPFAPGLEVVTLTRHGRTAVVPFFFSIPSGRHLRMKGVKRCAARQVRFEGGDGIPYQLDGDSAGFLPVTIRASDERVWVLLPRDTKGPAFPRTPSKV
ncbi:MAG TPA: diacylglycerol kinase family protein [Thermoanaerobaculaceae bacterium]|nr:diacylglycerol kinase family protein [Thermoanaerobaculaceae bacterium]